MLVVWKFNSSERVIPVVLFHGFLIFHILLLLITHFPAIR